jgi:iron complex outermembrane receptor protein
MHDLRRPLIAVVSLGLLLAPAALAADPVITLAQADPASDTGIEEELESTGGAIGPPPDAEVFRVKGRAVTAIEQDVPTSATQFDAADIEALGAQSIEDLAKVTPNLEIRTTGATTPTFFIRGVGLSDFNANAPGAISIYQDNIAINAPAIQLGLLYDLENVAIQRGPQGDGPYRNASGGAIQVIGRKPTGAREASLRFDYGNYSFVDVEGAVEIPLTEESLQTRLSFRYVARDGYVTNGCGDIPVNMAERLNGGSTYDRVSFCGESFRGFANPNGPGRLRLSVVPEGLPSKINDRGQWAARAYLRYQPPETDMDFIFNIHGSRLNQLASLGQAIGTRRPGFGQPTSAGYQDKDIIEIQDSLIEGLGSLPLANQALEEVLANNLDSDPFRGDFNRVGDTTLDTWGAYLEAHVPIGDVNFRSITGGEWYTRFRETDTDFTPDRLFEIVRTDSAWQITQDFQLRGEMDNTPLKWTTGAFFLTQNLVSDSEFFFFVESQNALQEYEEITYSLGVYGMLDWEFLDDFTLHAGGRYNWENKSFDVMLTRADFPKRQRTWSAPTGTVSLTYRFTDLVQAYWKYNRGWKGGHFNAASAAGRETAEAEPETINSFEIGMNGTWLDGRLHFDS